MNKIKIKKCYPYNDYFLDRVIYSNYLEYRNLSIEDISFVKDMIFLQNLCLGGNHISDLFLLENLTHLETLYLWINDIEDISSLKKLVNLKKLDLIHNPISQNQIKELQEALPNCKIIY